MLRRRKTPTQLNLETQVEHAVARLAKHYGIEEAHALVYGLTAALATPGHPYRDAIIATQRRNP